jgi:type I restriction enzyme S subunit
MKESGVAWLGDVPEGWEVWKFSHFAPIITCGIASTPTYVDENEGMPFLSAQNIQGNKLSLHKYNYISHELHRQLTQHRKPERGDLLVTRVGAGIGAACVIETDLEFSIYVSLTHIRVLPHIANNRFIAYFFSTDYCQYLNHQGTVTGGGVGNLNVQNVVKYQIPLPSIEEQIKIADYIDSKNLKFAALIESVESAIELMQERRTALISAAVTGKIDVRHWGD